MGREEERGQALILGEYKSMPFALAFLPNSLLKKKKTGGFEKKAHSCQDLFIIVYKTTVLNILTHFSFL
jgi:hypothetical protein